MDHIILDSCDESNQYVFFWNFFLKAFMAFVETFPSQRFATKGEREVNGSYGQTVQLSNRCIYVSKLQTRTNEHQQCT